MNHPYRIELLNRTPQTGALRPPLLFVHGACHDARCWDQFWMPWFAEQGWNCHALSLRGHGESAGRAELNQHSLDDYLDDVIHAMDQLKAKPVLIGHSMGGCIVQMAMERSPHRIAAAVLLASTPPGWLTTGEQLRMLSSPKAMWAARSLINGEELCTEHIRALPFFSGRTDYQSAEIFCGLLQAESDIARSQIPQLHTRSGKPSFPLMVLGSRADALIGASVLERTARHYGVEAEILDRCCHDLMLDPAWMDPATRTADWLTKRFP